jgi:hypothetical protein
MADGVHDLLKELSNKSGWIPSMKLLPEQDEEVLATDGKSVFFAHVLGGLSLPIWCNKHSSGPIEVTHWKYIPVLPGGGEVK